MGCHSFLSDAERKCIHRLKVGISATFTLIGICIMALPTCFLISSDFVRQETSYNV